MPLDRAQYPPHWPEISQAVRERAGWRCEWCSQDAGTTRRQLNAAEERLRRE